MKKGFFTKWQAIYRIFHNKTTFSFYVLAILTIPVMRTLDKIIPEKIAVRIPGTDAYMRQGL